MTEPGPAFLPLYPATFWTYFPAAQKLAVRRELFGRVYQWRLGLGAVTACLWRFDNAAKRCMRENHKSKHISSPTPFLFLPMCLSQSLAQVWLSGSSSLATAAWRSACRVHCHFTCSSSWLHFSLPFCPSQGPQPEKHWPLLLPVSSVMGVWVSTELSGES